MQRARTHLVRGVRSRLRRVTILHGQADPRNAPVYPTRTREMGIGRPGTDAATRSVRDGVRDHEEGSILDACRPQDVVGAGHRLFDSVCVLLVGDKGASLRSAPAFAGLMALTPAELTLVPDRLRADDANPQPLHVVVDELLRSWRFPVAADSEGTPPRGSCRRSGDLGHLPEEPGLVSPSWHPILDRAPSIDQPRVQADGPAAGPGCGWLAAGARAAWRARSGEPDGVGSEWPGSRGDGAGRVGRAQEGLEQAGAYRTGNGLSMAAAGDAGPLLSLDGFGLAVKFDAFLVRTASDAVAGRGSGERCGGEAGGQPRAGGAGWVAGAGLRARSRRRSSRGAAGRRRRGDGDGPGDRLRGRPNLGLMGGRAAQLLWRIQDSRRSLGREPACGMQDLGGLVP